LRDDSRPSNDFESVIFSDSKTMKPCGYIVYGETFKSNPFFNGILGGSKETGGVHAFMLFKNFIIQALNNLQITNILWSESDLFRFKNDNTPLWFFILFYLFMI
jgi:hypothetical protein